MLGLLSAASPLVSEAQTPKRGGTLHVSYGNEVSYLDFHTAPGYEIIWVAMNVGCGLINITPDGRFVGEILQRGELLYPTTGPGTSMRTATAPAR